MSENTSEICALTAVEISEKVRSKELSPVEVVNAVLNRMDQLEPTLHAFCTPAPEAARADAKAIEKEVMSGVIRGPLVGVPVGIKDLVFTKGIRTTGGSWEYAEFVPDEDDVVVERLKDAGAVILGKTNVTEFGYSGAGHNPVFEATRNPWNTSRTSGGSSSGSGAAVAAGMGPFAIGSDGGGSIRNPSSLCGIYGIKPSMGRVPLYPGCRDERFPGFSSFESLEHIGPMSRTVADSALALSVIAGPDYRDRLSIPESNLDWVRTLENPFEGLRIAYSEDWGYAAVDPEVRAVVSAAVKVFERDYGCIVEEAHPGWDDPLDDFWTLVLSESDLRGMRAMADRLGDRMTPHLSEALRTDWTAEQFSNAARTRQTMNNKMARFMQNYDLLITPTTAVPAFPVGIQGPEMIDGQDVHMFAWLPFAFPLNMTGQPAASVPAGFTTDGLPVGMQIIGRHLDDALVLRASAAFEAAAPWKDRWPSIVSEIGAQ